MPEVSPLLLAILSVVAAVPTEALAAETPAAKARVLGSSFSGPPAPAPGSGLVVATDLEAGDPFAPLLAMAVRLLRPKKVLTFQRDDLSTVRAEMEALRPEYVLIVTSPETIDLTFHLGATAFSMALDDDPFPDFLLGYLTGATPQEAIRFLEAGSRTRSRRSPRTFVEMDYGIASHLSPWRKPSWCPRMKGCRIVHADPKLLHENRGILEGAGILLLDGEGSPWGIDSGMDSVFLRDAALRLHPAVLLSGADRLGTVDYYYPDGVKARSRRIAPAESFCLAAIAREASALVLPLGPGSQGLAEQELESLCVFGSSVGEARKRVMDAAVTASGLEDARDLLDTGAWEAPEKTPPLSRAFSRAVFGDPRFAPYPGGLSRDLVHVKVEKEEDSFQLSFVLLDPSRLRTFTEFFSTKDPRDRVCFTVGIDVEEGEAIPSTLSVLDVKAGKRHPKIARLRAAWERRGQEILLHVEIVMTNLGGQRPFRDVSRVEGDLVLGQEK